MLSTCSINNGYSFQTEVAKVEHTVAILANLTTAK